MRAGMAMLGSRLTAALVPYASRPYGGWPGDSR
jgi:hypothetical protein